VPTTDVAVPFVCPNTARSLLFTVNLSDPEITSVPGVPGVTVPVTLVPNAAVIALFKPATVLTVAV
jgi:hypothetical protein